jgi:hypothetical protein
VTCPFEYKFGDRDKVDVGLTVQLGFPMISYQFHRTKTNYSGVFITSCVPILEGRSRSGSLWMDPSSVSG